MEYQDLIKNQNVYQARAYTSLLEGKGSISYMDHLAALAIQESQTDGQKVKKELLNQSLCFKMYTLEWATEIVAFLPKSTFYRLLQAYRTVLTDETTNQLSSEKIEHYRDQITGSTASLAVCKKIGEIIEENDDVCLED